ncbi:hypothetical protein RIF29_30040 [Crotalaria pallida]|uniref:Uncharacterized protein n=1 Tax=Crotalaria pallida TaxID=3830 RepID=A0AAN9I0Y5_CROPI
MYRTLLFSVTLTTNTSANCVSISYKYKQITEVFLIAIYWFTYIHVFMQVHILHLDRMNMSTTFCSFLDKEHCSTLQLLKVSTESRYVASFSVIKYIGFSEVSSK